MLVGEIPRTIDDAELAGWQGLEIGCEPCRETIITWWAIMRRRTRRRVLAEVRERLVCEKCKAHPTTVKLYRATYPVKGGSPENETLEI